MLRAPTMRGDGIGSLPAGGGDAATALAAALGGDAADYLIGAAHIWRQKLHVDFTGLPNKDILSDATHDIGADADLVVTDSAVFDSIDITNGVGLVAVASASGTAVRLAFDLDALTVPVNPKRELRLVWVFTIVGGQVGDRVMPMLVDSATATYTVAIMGGVKWTGGTDRKLRYQLYTGGWNQGDGAVLSSLDGQTYRLELNVRDWHAKLYADVATGLAEDPEDGTFHRSMNTGEAAVDTVEADPWSAGRFARIDIIPSGATECTVTVTDCYVLEAL